MTNSNSPPDHFVCPISLDVMQFPVRDRRTGQTFERGAILEWIFVHGNRTCPLTRQPLETQHLRRAFDLQREIAVWKQQQQPKMEPGCDQPEIDITGLCLDRTTLAALAQQKDLFQDQERLVRLDTVRRRVMAQRDERFQRLSSAANRR